MPSAVSAAGFSTAAGSAPVCASAAVSGKASRAAMQRQAHGISLPGGRFEYRGRDLAFARPLRQHATGRSWIDHQYGVLPYRLDAAGKAEILLITSQGAAALGRPQGQSDPLLPQLRIGGARGVRGSRRRGPDRDRADRQLPLREKAARGRRRRRRSSPSIRCWSPARPRTGPSAASASGAGFRPRRPPPRSRSPSSA